MGGLTSLLLLLCVGVTVSTVLDLQKRIIGGDNCPDDKRGYHVKILDKNDKFLCGGSLLKNNWILTAEHCTVSVMKAVVGVHPGTKPVTVTITAPPVIYKDGNGRKHDIMLLKLPSSFNDIKPVDLPADCAQKPLKVEIAGHAATTGGPKDERKLAQSPTLRCAEVDVVSCKDLENTLKKELPDFYKIVEFQQRFCGQSPGKDICKGDSGGGVVYQDKIYGVISFLDPFFVCRNAGAFMDLCNPEYAKWVRETIDIKIPPV